MAINPNPTSNTSIAGRVTAALFVVSAVTVGGGYAYHEGFSATPYVPTQGDVPTIGFGSTVYEDGTKVTLEDRPITVERALQIANAHSSADEKFFDSVVGHVPMYKCEKYVGVNFIYQFGKQNFYQSASKNSSMYRALISQDYKKYCESFMLYRYQAGRDCCDPIAGGWGTSTGCKGVCTRQQERVQICLKAQTIMDCEHATN